MPAPRFGETDEEVQNEAQKSILRVFHALILSDFFGASALDKSLGILLDFYRLSGNLASGGISVQGENNAGS